MMGEKRAVAGGISRPSAGCARPSTKDRRGSRNDLNLNSQRTQWTVSE